MNVAINTSPLAGGHSARGTGVYTRHLIDALETFETGNTYTFFTSPRDIPKHSDVVHYPFFDPFFLTLPLVKTKPTVVTVHDLIPLVFPDKFPPGLKGTLKWQMQKQSLLGSRRIITDSKQSRDDIVTVTAFSKERIDVVPLAATRANSDASEKTIALVKKQYGLPQRYFLYVGDVNWNKNVIGLLRAWQQFRETDTGRTAALVLVGSAFMKPEVRETGEILSFITRHGLSDSVIRTGFIKDEDLASVYQGAVALVVPSWYEGFGLPVLDAFASGIPVISSTGGSLPEIAGPAIPVKPDDYSGMSNAMEQIASLSSLKRSALIQKGHEWEKRFTWKKTAALTVKSYEKALNHHSNV